MKILCEGHLLGVFCVNPFVGKRAEIVFHPNSVFEMHLLRTSMFGMEFFAFCNDTDLFPMNPFSCSLQTLLYQTRTLGIIVLLIHFPVKVFRRPGKQSGGGRTAIHLISRKKRAWFIGVNQAKVRRGTKWGKELKTLNSAATSAAASDVR